MNRLPLAALLLLAPITLAADAPAPEKPKSPAATAAVAKADKAAAEAEAAARAAVLKARRAEVDDLKAAQEVALKGGAAGLAEANAIGAEVRRVQAEIEAMKGPSVSQGPKGVDWIVGTTWKFKGGPTWVRYPAAGVVESSAWNGARGTWSATDADTITQVESGKVRTVVTFTRDRRHALWVYPDKGEVAWAVRGE